MPQGLQVPAAPQVPQGLQGGRVPPRPLGPQGRPVGWVAPGPQGQTSAEPPKEKPSSALMLWAAVAVVMALLVAAGIVFLLT